MSDLSGDLGQENKTNPDKILPFFITNAVSIIRKLIKIELR